jgi:hypothetical protein
MNPSDPKDRQGSVIAERSGQPYTSTIVKPNVTTRAKRHRGGTSSWQHQKLSREYRESLHPDPAKRGKR